VIHRAAPEFVVRASVAGSAANTWRYSRSTRPDERRAGLGVEPRLPDVLGGRFRRIELYGTARSSSSNNALNR